MTESTIEKVFSENIMKGGLYKPRLGEQLMLPGLKPSIIFSNPPPQTIQSTALTKSLVSLGEQDPMSLLLFMIALSSIYTETTEE